MGVRPCSDLSLFRKIPVILDEALRNDLILTWLPLKNLYRKSHSEVLGVRIILIWKANSSAQDRSPLDKTFVLVSFQEHLPNYQS